MWSTVKGTRVVVNSQPPVDTSRGSTGSGNRTICNKGKRTECKCHDSNQVRDRKLNQCSVGSAQKPWGIVDSENKTGGRMQAIDRPRGPFDSSNKRGKLGPEVCRGEGRKTAGVPEQIMKTMEGKGNRWW